MKRRTTIAALIISPLLMLLQVAAAQTLTAPGPATGRLRCQDLRVSADVDDDSRTIVVQVRSPQIAVKRIFTLAEPPRIVADLRGKLKGDCFNQINFTGGPLRSLRIGTHPRHTRIVAELDREPGEPLWHVEEGRLLLKSELKEQQPEAAQAPPVTRKGWDEMLPEDLQALQYQRAEVNARPEDAGNPCFLHARIKTESAYRIRDSARFTKIRASAAPREGCDLGTLQLRAGQRFWYDAVYDWTGTYPENVADDMEREAVLRDLYLDYSLGDFDVRLGQQQIVWGETVGFFIADVVNAKDYREFILPELAEINIPEPALDLEYTKNGWHGEAVWIPRPRFNKLPQPGSEFAFPAPEMPPGAAKADEDKPEGALRNSEAGTRLGYLWNEWDLGAFYLYTWDKSPVFTRSAKQPLLLEPVYKRLNIFGLTASKEISDIVWRGELAFNREAVFSTLDPADADGLGKSDFVDYAIGSDFRWSGATRVNLQLLQRIFSDHDSSFAGNPDQVRTYFSLWLGSKYFDEKFVPELFIIASPFSADAMLRPRLGYKLTDNWLLGGGLDVFSGDKDGLFGQFEGRSRVYGELSYEL